MASFASEVPISPQLARGFVAAVVVGLLAYGLSRCADWLAKQDVVLSIARAGRLVLILDFYFGWALTNQTPTSCSSDWDLRMRQRSIGQRLCSLCVDQDDIRVGFGLAR
jgi:hypothetical protein